MKRVLSLTSLILFVAHCVLAEAEPESYQTIKIKSVFSKLITRDQADRVYSGQIKSEAGLYEFEKTFGVDLDMPEVNFEKQMLIFGITDNISSRAFQFLKQKKIRTYTLDYAETGIEYGLRNPGEGKKHSHIQVFVLKKIEGIPHIQVKDLVRNGLSCIYDK